MAEMDDSLSSPELVLEKHGFCRNGTCSIDGFYYGYYLQYRTPQQKRHDPRPNKSARIVTLVQSQELLIYDVEVFQFEDGCDRWQACEEDNSIPHCNNKDRKRTQLLFTVSFPYYTEEYDTQISELDRLLTTLCSRPTKAELEDGDEERSW